MTVLTGYRDFDYAQRALHLGVSRFLLKPSHMEELEEAILYMTGQLEGQGAGEEPANASANSFLVRQAQAFLAQNYARHLTLQEVADHCYISQWYLSKLLNRQLGQNFYELLNGVRIQRAKELMEDPSLRISEIAELVGYSDTAHFSRVFKKQEGVSAGDWRNTYCYQPGR